MSSSLWSSGLAAHKYRLSFPTIADVMDIADAVFARVLSIDVDDAPSTSVDHPMTADKKQTEDAEPTQVIKESTMVDSSVPALDVLETEPATIIEQTKSTTPIDTGLIDTTTLPSNTEVHRYHHAVPIMDIVEVNDTSASYSEVHTYHHLAPTINIIGVSAKSAAPSHVADPVDDLGAFISSVDYNDFERFPGQNRMWGVHRPAIRKPSIRASRAVQKKDAVPSVKNEKVEKGVVTGTSAGVVNACTSSDSPQSDDIIYSHERKLSTE